MNTLGDSGDSNALCSAVRSVTCLCSIVYTGTDQGWLLFVQAELSGAHFILELPATATTTKSTFTIDLVVILQLSHQSLWSNSKCTWMMQIWSCHSSLLGEKRKSKQTNKRNIHIHIHNRNSVICFQKKKTTTKKLFYVVYLFIYLFIFYINKRRKWSDLFHPPTVCKFVWLHFLCSRHRCVSVDHFPLWS